MLAASPIGDGELRFVETDSSRFIGRGKALKDRQQSIGDLSGTTGTVSIRFSAFVGHVIESGKKGSGFIRYGNYK